MFNVGRGSHCPLFFRGLSIRYGNDITVSQQNYAEQLQEKRFLDFKTDAPLTEELLSEACCALGKLQWVSSQTRPDLSYSANSLSSDLGNASRAPLLEINKAKRKAKSTTFNLEYAPLADFDRLVVYADAPSKIFQLVDHRVGTLFSPRIASPRQFIQYLGPPDVFNELLDVLWQPMLWLSWMTSMMPCF